MPEDQAGNPWKKLEGVEFAGPAEIFSVDGFGVIASQMEFIEFSEDEFKERLKNDLEFVKKNIERHYNIIENFNHNGAIIPFKFAVIFKTMEGLEESIRREKNKFMELLDKFQGKEEWGVRVFLNKREAERSIRKFDMEIKAMEGKKEKAGQGMKWYLEKKEEELVSERLEAATEKKISSLAKELEGFTSGCVVNNPVNRPGDKREIILNNACLLPKEKVTDFRRKIAGLSLVLKNSGMDLEITGPWPPFNFSRM